MTNPTETAATGETAIVADIIMRVLGGRNLQVCLNSLASAIITLASDVPKEGRDYISEQTKSLAEAIDSIEDEESPQVDAFPTETTATH